MAARKNIFFMKFFYVKNSSKTPIDTENSPNKKNKMKKCHSVIHRGKTRE